MHQTYQTHQIKVIYHSIIPQVTKPHKCLSATTANNMKFSLSETTANVIK